MPCAITINDVIHRWWYSHDVWHTPVRRFEEMVDDPQANAVEGVIAVPGLPYKLVSPPYKLSDSHGIPQGRAPHLGADTEAILAKLAASTNPFE